LLSSEALFGPKCTKCRLAAGLRPDPLGELNVSRLPSRGWGWNKGREGKGERKKREGTGEREENLMEKNVSK